MKKLISFIMTLAMILALVTVPAAAAGTASGNSVEQLCNNFVACMADGTLSVFATPRSNYSFDSNMSHLCTDTDGTMYFSTIDYAKYVKNDDFTHLSDHLSRALAMAKVYVTTDDADVKEQLSEIIPALIGYWVKNDYQCTNWWYNEINTPNLLGEIALLAKDDISDELMEGVLAIVGDGCLTINTDLKSETGANAVWVAYSTLKYGMLANNKSVVNTAVSKLESVLAYQSGEGIKADGSFLQHGARLYNGAYGISLIDNTASILRILEGTDYALTADQLSALSNMIVNGLQYMSIGNVIDPQTVGRDISRNGGTDISGLSDSISTLLTLNAVPDKTALKQYADTIDNNTRQNLGLKYYDNAKFIVINNEDFYFSYRGAASNLYYAENLNNENVLSYNSSYGTTTTIAGDVVNFNDLQPIMDYALIPGTTAIYEDDEALDSYNDYNKRKLSGTFGGESYGDIAVSFAQTTHEGTSYTVACFATDTSAVLLGAGLTNTSGKAMNTTLQQELAQGSYTKDGNTVTHNGIKYTVYDGGELNAQIKTQTGSWSRNKVSGSTASVSGDVFTLSMVNDGAYAYSVMSDDTNDSYEVIANNEKVQAVIMPDGSLCAAFYKNASISYNGKTYSGTAGQSICISADELNAPDRCVSTVSVSLSTDGTYDLSLGGTAAGRYTFTKSGSGWLIQNTAGQYIGVDASGNLSVGAKSVWTYDGGFYVQISKTTKVLFWNSTKNTSYYLQVKSGALSTSTSKASASFTQEISSAEHSYCYIDNKNGTHSKVCSVCGKVAEDCVACVYDGSTHRCVCCGHFDSSFAKLSVSVNVTKATTKKLFISRTTYTATITASCEGDTVKTVQYSKNGSTWTTGTSYSSSSAISSLYVKVSTAAGGATTWYYNGSTTTQQS